MAAPKNLTERRGYATHATHSDYLKDEDLRKRIGDLIEDSTDLSNKSGNRIQYHEAQIRLLQERPQTTVADRARATETINNHLAQMAEL